MEIKFEPITNGKFATQLEIEERNKKALAYSQKCKRKNEFAESIKCGIVTCIYIFALIIL